MYWGVKLGAALTFRTAKAATQASGFPVAREDVTDPCSDRVSMPSRWLLRPSAGDSSLPYQDSRFVANPIVDTRARVLLKSERPRNRLRGPRSLRRPGLALASMNHLGGEAALVD